MSGVGGEVEAACVVDFGCARTGVEGLGRYFFSEVDGNRPGMSRILTDLALRCSYA